MLEQEIIPLYYSRNRRGYSENWVRTIKNSIAQIAPHYTMKRQLDDYYDKFYTPQAQRYHLLAADDAQRARDLAAWKELVAERWDAIRVVSSERSENLASATLESGTEFTVTHVVDEAGLDDAIGLELVVIATDHDTESVHEVIPMNVVRREGNLYTFQIRTSVDYAGTFKFAYRMFPNTPSCPTGKTSATSSGSSNAARSKKGKSVKV